MQKVLQDLPLLETEALRKLSGSDVLLMQNIDNHLANSAHEILRVTGIIHGAGLETQRDRATMPPTPSIFTGE